MVLGSRRQYTDRASMRTILLKIKFIHFFYLFKGIFMLIRIFYLQYPQHNNYLFSSYHLKSQKFELCKVTSKTACKIRWVLKHYHLRNLFTNGACEPNGMQFFAHRSPSDSRNESCNLLSINSMQIYASEIIFTSKFQTAPRQYADSLLYATPFHTFHSVYKAKQYSWGCSTNNLQKTCFLRHNSSQIEDWVLVAFLTSEKSCVLEIPFCMCLCIKNIHTPVLIKRAANIFLCLTETTVFFYWRDIIFQKNLAVCILAEVSAYWRSKIKTSTKNSLNYEILANYANN